MRTLREYRKELLGNQYDTNNIGKLLEERRKSMVREYSRMGFNWHSVLRIKNRNDYTPYSTKVYNNKMSSKFVDKVMDRIAIKNEVDLAVAFVEQDDYLNNHLHFAWKSPVEFTLSQLAKSMKTPEWNFLPILPIHGELKAIEYFTKRVGKTGFYSNIYA